MHRLVAYAQNGVQRFAVDRSELLIGSGDDCDIKLPYAGVGRQHARLRSGGDDVEIEDLGSRKGVIVNGKRVRHACLQVLDEIRLGSIALLLEDVVPEVEPEAAAVAANAAPDEVVIDPPRMLEHLARVSQWVLADSSSATTLESLVIALLSDFGGGVMFLFQGEDDSRGIKFVVATDERWLGSGDEILRQVNEHQDTHESSEVVTMPSAELTDEPAWMAYRSIRALDRPYLFVVALPNFQEQAWSPLGALRTLGDQLILGLVHHVGQFEPILFGRREQLGLTLAPGLIAGESESMKRTLAQLQAAIDPPVHVLLRGEPGVSKELLAHSLHLSSSRRDGPFVTASCVGAKSNQIEAGLFGAEIPGKHGPLIREGKLLLADGGTLYLEDIEYLPLELQDRLVRFIRSGELEPTESLSSTRVDVRLVAACRKPLESQVARDKFRIDLAYRLAQFTVDVPALRERRADLPLLIQAAVNRCCHQTSKRIQGITVKAMEALAVYDYPGNLPELENIVRRLVYLCASGQPIDDSMLPEEVRLGKIQGLRPETTSELHLERLVADCERAAIREALRRSNGNKSAAARLLGLSRNGLAMKINRLGLSESDVAG
ncbi:MAG: sigma 54-interacting transcriptional regulator [Acidobacteriota bacterium]